jgi:glycosyltransferase involved in cell wall biosynthesis
MDQATPFAPTRAIPVALATERFECRGVGLAEFPRATSRLQGSREASGIAESRTHGYAAETPLRAKGNPMPFFSVVLATRNRPALFRRALASVLAQSCQDFEIIVVNDGSADEHQPAYESIIDAADPLRVRSFDLIPRPQGHGGSFARNFGAAKANGTYLCSLDDDDMWTDPNHLGRAQAVIAESNAPVDIYLTNQVAFQHDQQLPGPIWIEDLPPVLAKLGNRPDRHGTHTVTVEELLRSRGFCHLNTLIVRRALYEEVGGLDERNGWEHDRDLYLRLIDQAGVIKYAPIVVARHNAADPTKAVNLTTMHVEFERLLSQLRLLDRAIYFSRQAAIRAYGRRYKAYTLKRIAESLAAAGRHTEAAFYAREALGAGPTAKWAAFTVWQVLKQALTRPRSPRA